MSQTNEKSVTFRISESSYKNLKLEADKQERTVSGQIRIILEKQLNKEKNDGYTRC